MLIDVFNKDTWDDENDDDGFEPAPVADLPKPTEGQDKAIKALVEMIMDDFHPYRWVLLDGWAGTGKTWTINRVVEEVKRLNPRINFGMTAPTHKAVRQLQKHSEMKDKLDFGTIHSFLGLKEVQKPDPKDAHKMIVRYELEWNAKRERKIDNIDVLVVDESSMLGDELFDHIDDALRNMSHLKVIFMGDSLQIPPVREEKGAKYADAIPFVAEQRQSRSISHLVLSEVVRQADTNPIIGYSASIREQVANQRIDHKFGIESNVGVEVLPRNITILRRVFTQYFDTPQFREDPDYVKVIAWRNDTVDYFNREIRLLIHKADTLPRYLIGEKLVLDKPVLKGDKVVLPNNDELEILDFTVIDYPVKYNFKDTNAFNQVQRMDKLEVEKREIMFKAYKCRVNALEKKNIDVILLHEDSEEEYKQLRDLLAATAQKLSRMGDHYGRIEMWKEFYRIEKEFAWAKYNYAVTAHKAQGSTYDYCISMEWDIEQNWDIKERNRIRYVAATRARHKLYIVR